MAERNRIIREIPVTGSSSNCIVISVRFNAGGINYASYENEKRGYYLSVQPVTKSDGWQTIKGFSGVKGLVEEAKRFGQKKLDNLVVDEARVNQFIEYVLERNNLKLAEEPVAA
ncbi:hypothetical protein [Pseudoalteromonas sp. S554]|uniref:hypothetical protein n=1 Tax=Pseudoalteromonas sp. S554 TaxID=2066516 RepID=UPI00110CE15B|nr:hypothetical protein [Pseudoalteromonas sp. S554]TMS80559.1 hypothetical protein CWB65_14670 [Pseudoalteromonas sp. S554]